MATKSNAPKDEASPETTTDTKDIGFSSHQDISFSMRYLRGIRTQIEALQAFFDPVSRL